LVESQSQLLNGARIAADSVDADRVDSYCKQQQDWLASEMTIIRQYLHRGLLTSLLNGLDTFLDNWRHLVGCLISDLTFQQSTENNI
jgi:hypothetical protein